MEYLKFRDGIFMIQFINFNQKVFKNRLRKGVFFIESESVTLHDRLQTDNMSWAAIIFSSRIFPRPSHSPREALLWQSWYRSSSHSKQATGPGKVAWNIAETKESFKTECFKVCLVVLTRFLLIEETIALTRSWVEWY